MFTTLIPILISYSLCCLLMIIISYIILALLASQLSPFHPCICIHTFDSAFVFASLICTRGCVVSVYRVIVPSSLFFSSQLRRQVCHCILFILASSQLRQQFVPVHHCWISVSPSRLSNNQSTIGSDDYVEPKSTLSD